MKLQVPLSNDLYRKVKTELNSRYAACDMLGYHVNDEGLSEICSNCFRHLEYKGKEIQFQKEKDFFDGLLKILESITEEP